MTHLYGVQITITTSVSGIVYSNPGISYYKRSNVCGSLREDSIVRKINSCELCEAERVTIVDLSAA